jgi:hypothetical protein
MWLVRLLTRHYSLFSSLFSSRYRGKKHSKFNWPTTAKIAFTFYLLFEGIHFPRILPDAGRWSPQPGLNR